MRASASAAASPIAMVMMLKGSCVRKWFAKQEVVSCVYGGGKRQLRVLCCLVVGWWLSYGPVGIGFHSEAAVALLAVVALLLELRLGT